MYIRLQGFTGVYRDEQRNTGVYRSIHGSTEEYRGLQECTGVYIRIHAQYIISKGR